MVTLELKGKKREIFGKKLKALRKQGLIPAVIYPVRNFVSNGVNIGKSSALPITIDLKEFRKVLKNAGETTLIKLFIDDIKFSAKGGPASGWKNVLIHDISRDPVTDDVRHVDFYEVKMDEKIITKVPLVFIGNSLAVSDLGGVLVKAMQEIQIRSLPADLPHEIEVNISSLIAFEDTIAIKDIAIPKNIEVLENETSSVASVAPPRTDEEIEALSGQVEEKVEDITAETEEKVAERVKESEETTK